MSAFNELIAFTANVWQNIDGLVFTAVAIYLLIRLAKSVLGHDESTIKTSTSFDYLGAFPRESDHKVFLLEDVWKLPFHEKTVRACFRQADEEQPFLCIPNRSVWLSLHDFYSGMRNDSVPRALTDLRQDHTLHRVSHILGITFGNYEIQQARIEDLAAPKLLDIFARPGKGVSKSSSLVESGIGNGASTRAAGTGGAGLLESSPLVGRCIDGTGFEPTSLIGSPGAVSD